MTPQYDNDAVRRQYASDERLRIRQEIHEKYTTPRVDFPAWALKHVRWRGDERVLDLGCGPGLYFTRLHENWPEIEYHGVDYSAAMLRIHASNSSDGHLLQSDAQHLPYGDDVFDVVMANHMLYHIADIEAAVVEIKRVLKPGGVLMAATNSIQSMPELQILMRRAIILLTREDSSYIQAPSASSERFSLESGTRVLSRYFYALMRNDLPSTLVFTEIDPIIQYVESTRDLREPQLPEDVLWDDVIVIMRQQITHLINHLGELPVNKLAGVLIATDNGDFVRDFLDKYEAGQG
jgi:ubiquinone/menaquinone biosynthesis C-methylase UbiE